MNTNHLYRQEHIRLLWVHHQQTSNLSAKLEEQRKSLKVSQRQSVQTLGFGLGILKRVYLRMKHFSQMREFNRNAEHCQENLHAQQQEEIKRLKSSWEMRYSYQLS